MKKMVSLFLVVFLMMSISVGIAEKFDTEIKKSGDLEIADADVEKDDEAKSPMQSTKGSLTQDVVTITENDDNTISYKVITPTGIILNYTSGSALAFTQDLLQQADWFVEFYNDPRSITENWINRDMHLNIYEISSDTDIYVFVHPTSLSRLYPESRELSEADAAAILNALKSKKTYFQNAAETSVGWLGDNVWFLADMRNVDGTITLVSFVGGVEIYAYARVSDVAQYEAIINELEKLQISAG